ncbi:MAG: hypothetical protein AB1775_06250 [Bacteroidota bacterium]
MKALNNVQLENLTGGQAPLDCNQILALAYFSYGLGDLAGGDWWMGIYNLGC